jgi:hypothetical protein
MNDAPQPRYTRRLSDKVLIAFHQACDQGNIEVARPLLEVLEFMLKRPPRLQGSGPSFAGRRSGPDGP